MPEIRLGGRSIPVDGEGFLTDPAAWDEAVVQDLADSLGIGPLGPDHWKVVRYLRDYHARTGGAPLIRVLCRDTGFTLGGIYALFPPGPAQGACRVAGLPKPSGCV